MWHTHLAPQTIYPGSSFIMIICHHHMNKFKITRKLSRHDMLAWVNDCLGSRYSKVEELCTGRNDNPNLYNPRSKRDLNFYDAVFEKSCFSKLHRTLHNHGSKTGLNFKDNGCKIVQTTFKSQQRIVFVTGVQFAQFEKKLKSESGQSDLHKREKCI